ncbi:MAG TPA: class I SAM-dependent methyltransferase, partial [Thermoanaerobaculia bacterium]|nr:class I SAM-dependent methyltransferase [Thermoanaerobaculia bacterium]
MVGSFVKAVFRKLGYEIERLPGETASPQLLHTCRGVDWNLAEADRFLATVVPKYRAEFERFPVAPTTTNAYHVSNPYFARVDAAICHSFVRERKPDIVVEIGSGMSSRVIRAALDLNGMGRLVCIDPEPRAEVSDVAHEWIQKPVQDVPLSFFADLPVNAVVFIDSSHNAGTGSDVNYLLLEVLPSLKPGTT